MGFIQDFKSFALKGNVIDLAVGVIIGGAFGKIVTALVDDIIMPMVGVLTGKGTQFTDKFIVLTPGKNASGVYESLAAAKADGANIFAYGDFIQTIVNFIIIALSIFMFVRLFTRLQRKQEEEKAAAPAPSATETLLTEIRDLLKKDRQA